MALPSAFGGQTRRGIKSGDKSKTAITMPRHINTENPPITGGWSISTEGRKGIRLQLGKVHTGVYRVQGKCGNGKECMYIKRGSAGTT